MLRLASFSHRKGALRALALLAVSVGVGILAPALHVLEHAGEHEAAIQPSERASAIEPACPQDCNEPGHRHLPHGPATCHACKAFHAPVVVASLSPCAPIAPSSLALAARSSVHRARLTAAHASPRGPPSRLS